MVAKKDKIVPSDNEQRPRVATLRKTPLPPGDDIGAAEMSRRVGTNLREMRKTRGLSLDQLSAASGVSRAALSQIETQKTNPSLGVLWKIAVGLGVHFAELIGQGTSGATVLRRADARVLRSADGRMESRPLTPAGACPWVEGYELRLAARAVHSSDAHAFGTREVVVVLNGQLLVRVGAEAHELASGDSIAFMADQPHGYENTTNSEARCHDIVIYTR
jgi:XRE family transcriptional regulator, regulator of sulfur utilization